MYKNILIVTVTPQIVFFGKQKRIPGFFNLKLRLIKIYFLMSYFLIKKCGPIRVIFFINM